MPTNPRPRFGPDGSITNLDEFTPPEKPPNSYVFCRRRGCGHPQSVHDEKGCHGQRLVTLTGLEGAEWAGSDTCECEKFDAPQP